MRVQQDHPTSPSNAKKKKVLFCGICFHTPPGAQPPKMPGPQLTSLARSLARSPRAPRPAARAPSRTCPERILLPRPRPVLTSWGPASVARPVWRLSVGLQQPLPPPPSLPPPLLPPPPKRCRRARRRGWKPGARGSREARAWARRGRTAGSCRREARGSRHPRPSSHNLAVRVGARPGRGEARTGRGRGGGGSPEPAGLDPGKRERARGRCLHGSARCVAGECVRARGVYSTLPSAAPAYSWGSPRFLPVTTTAAAAPGPDAPRASPGGGWIGRAVVAEAVPRARARDPYLKPRLASAGPGPALARARPPGPHRPGRRSASPAGASRRRGGASGRTFGPPGARALGAASGWN